MGPKGNICTCSVAILRKLLLYYTRFDKIEEFSSHFNSFFRFDGSLLTLLDLFSGLVFIN